MRESSQRRRCLEPCLYKTFRPFDVALVFINAHIDSVTLDEVRDVMPVFFTVVDHEYGI